MSQAPEAAAAGAARPRRAWQVRLGLAPHIRKRHLLGAAVHATASVAFLVLLNSLQPLLIQQLARSTRHGRAGLGSHAAHGGAPDGEREHEALVQFGRLNSTLLILDEGASIFLVLLWGSLAEIIGIRWVASVGYVLLAGGLSLYAIAQNAWPDLLVARLVFALGASAVTSMLSGLLASYSATDPIPSRASAATQAGDSAAATEDTPLLRRARASSHVAGAGKLASCAGVLTGVGALLAVFGLDRLPPLIARWLDERPPQILLKADKHHKHKTGDINLTQGLRLTFALSAALAVLVALILLLTLPSYDVKAGSALDASDDGSQAILEPDTDTDDVTPSAAAEALFHPEESQRSRWRRSVRSTHGASASAARTSSVFSDERQARRLRLRMRLGQRGVFRRTLWKLVTGLVQGIVDMRRSRTLVGAYIGGAMARATTIGTTAFLPLLVAHFFYTSGICSEIPDPTLPPSEIKLKCREAFTWTSIISGVAQLSALLLSPFVGIIADLVSPEATMSVAAGCGLGGYVLFAYGLPGGADGDPRSAQAIVAAALIGICQIGTIICSLALLAKARRLKGFASGSLAGAYSFFGGIGIVAVSSVGALLFDLYPPSPFIMMAVLAAATACAAGLIAVLPAV